MWRAIHRASNLKLAPLIVVVGLLVLTGCSTASARAAIGISDFTAEAVNRDGTLAFQAGTHPYEYALGVSVENSPEPEGDATLRGIAIDLPAGLVGDPLAVPRCRRQDFDAGLEPSCPGSTQIGVVHAGISGVGEAVAPLYDLVPPPGWVAAFGFKLSESAGLGQISVRTGTDYGLTFSEKPTPAGIELESFEVSIWGVPADPGHDAERVCIEPDGTRVEGCASGAPESALLTLPTSCAAPLEARVTVESVGGAIASRSAISRDAGGNPAALVGCQSVPFGPEVAVGFDSSAADSPTGATVGVHLPQPKGPEVRAEAALRDAVVELPEGVAINPPVAAGLGSCSPAQIGLLAAAGGSSLFTPDPPECPGPSKIGGMEVDTPLVDHPLRGGVYLATPHANPFGSLLAVYLAVDDEESGVVLKLPGLLEPDPLTGRLTLRLERLPQLPFEDLKLSFPGGPRAALRTPPVCGAGHVTARLTPWTAPEGLGVVRANVFRTSVSAGGTGACPTDEAQAPNAPAFTAGALFPLAGESSPFILRLGRQDGSQRFATLDVTLPPGLSGRLAGVPLCAEGRVASASCPADSQVGSVEVGAGAGSAPLRLAGDAYLAGPYRGAPLSLAIDVPAVAGPFDLGAVSVRVALYVDRRTAQVHAVADPLPRILSGIPLSIRSLALNLDRQDFVHNPTSCEPMTIAGLATSAAGGQIALRNRFQVGACHGLGFKPRLRVRLLGPSRRGAHPTLRAVLRPRPGDAVVSSLAVTLPGTELLDSRRIRDVCSRAAFAAGACSAKSAYGRAEVWTPLLDHPLVGPVYLRSSKRRLPALAIALGGQFRIDLVGSLSAARGRLRIAFGDLPDVPFSRFVLSLPGGRKGLLADSGGLCGGAKTVDVRFQGHNGRSHFAQPGLDVACSKETTTYHRRSSPVVDSSLNGGGISVGELPPAPRGPDRRAAFLRCPGVDRTLGGGAPFAALARRAGNRCIEW